MISFFHKGIPRALQPGETWQGSVSTDTYRDTTSSTLWSIVSEIESGAPWRELVGRHYLESNPWLHRIITDPSRDLFVRQFPPAAGSLVLDVGAGWGQYSLPLAKFCRVVCVEPTPERLAFIRAAAVQEGLASALCFIQADFLELEFPAVFDLACCIGVLEWVPKFRSGDPWQLQCEFLRRLRGGLKPGGTLLLGIENRLGLKYLLGAPDDHHGLPGISVLDASLASVRYREQTGQDLRSFTYSHAELTELLHAAGFGTLSFCGAFPDYKVPRRILPFEEPFDQQLLAEPLVEEHDGSCGRRLDFQEQLRSHYRSLAGMKLARYFSPSFFVAAKA